METTPNATSSASLHPLLWVAGISVTLLSLFGIAALTGILPVRPASVAERPAMVAAAPTSQAPVAPPAEAAPPAAASVAEPAVAPGKTVTEQRKTVKKVETRASPSTTKAAPRVAGDVPADYVPPRAAAPAPPACLDCGVVTNVREVTHEGKGTGAGAVIGGLAGGVLGSNVGRGNTRTLATIAGAVGGGLLGNTIEKSQRKTTAYQITVRMEDDTTRNVESATMPSWRIGDKVKVVDGTVVPR